MAAVHTFNASIGEVEAGESEFDASSIYRDFQSSCCEPCLKKQSDKEDPENV